MVRAILQQHYPLHREFLDEMFARCMSELPRSAATDAGVELGGETGRRPEEQKHHPQLDAPEVG